MTQDLRNRIAESIIVIAILVAAWFALVQPFQVRAEKGGARVRSLRTELEHFKATVELPPEQAQVHLARVDRMTRLAAPHSALAEHERILALAKENGLSIERINPMGDASPARIGPIMTGARQFRIETEGTFAELAAFLSALSTRAPMTVVDHFSIEAPDRSDPEHLTLSASVRVGRISMRRIDVAEVQP
jgi:hypothetical protein